jgi:hypothetical protein
MHTTNFYFRFDSLGKVSFAVRRQPRRFPPPWTVEEHNSAHVR